MSSWVLVTGGATRLGREIGLAFAHAGWNLACHCQHSLDAAQSLCTQVRSMGREALVVQGDLADASSCQAIFDEVAAHTHTALRCVVNNASLFLPDQASDFTETQALDQLRANLMAPMRMGKWLAALHIAQPAGHASLVHVLDQKVFNLNPDYFSYTLSKLALERAVSLQAQALAPALRVNAVAPGLMYLSGPQTAENFAVAARANLLRQPINPQDVAASVVFLAQNPSITGTTVRVDKGQHLVPLARDVMFVVDELFKS